MADNESQPLAGKALDWLKTQGYFLEMRVAKAFSEAGFSVSLFESYVDPHSGKIREVDVAASVSHEVAGIVASAALHVECKYCKSKPWVIMTSPRRCEPLFYFSRVLRGRFDVGEWPRYDTLQARVLASMLRSMGRESVSTFDFFRMPRRPGYSIVETYGAGSAKNNAYGAVMQAHNCAAAHDRRHESFFEEIRTAYAEEVYEARGSSTEFQLLASVAFPVVVAEGCMFECYLNAEGEVALSETSMNTVIVPCKDFVDPWKTTEYNSVVRVVTDDFVEFLAAQAKNALDALLSQEEALGEAWQYERLALTHEAERDEIPF